MEPTAGQQILRPAQRLGKQIKSDIPLVLVPCLLVNSVCSSVVTISVIIFHLYFMRFVYNSRHRIENNDRQRSVVNVAGKSITRPLHSHLPVPAKI